MRGSKGRRGALAGVAVAIAGAAPMGGCASGPGELQRLRVENELLREELRIVRSNCSYYRDVEMEVEQEPAQGDR
jgi:hypothetical protein